MAIFLCLTYTFEPTSWHSSKPTVTKRILVNSGAPWSMTITDIDKTLKETSIHYTGITFIYNSNPFKIIIKTNLQGKHTNEEVEMLTNITNELIIMNKQPLLLHDDEKYEIIIRGNDKIDLSRKVFF